MSWLSDNLVVFSAKHIFYKVICLFVCQSAVCLSVCLSVCLPVCLSIRRSSALYVSVCGKTASTVNVKDMNNGSVVNKVLDIVCLSFHFCPRCLRYIKCSVGFSRGLAS